MRELAKLGSRKILGWIPGTSLVLAVASGVLLGGAVAAADCTNPTVIAEGEDPSVTGPHIAFESFVDVDGVRKREIMYHHVPSTITYGTGVIASSGQNPEMSGSIIVFDGGYYDLGTGAAVYTDSIGRTPAVSGTLIASDIGGYLAYYDYTTGELVVTGERLQSHWLGSLSISGLIIAYATNEIYIDRDVDGDGRKQDPVIAYYDTAESTAIITDLLGDRPSISGSIIAYQWFDDDDDDAVRFYALDDSAVSGLRIKGGYDAEISGNTVVMYVFEHVRTEDLNGDGDLQDIIVGYYDLQETEQHLVSTGVAGYWVGVGNSVIAFVANENDDGRDWNGDGDQRDDVVLFCNVDADVGIPEIASMVDGYVADGSIDNAGVGEALDALLDQAEGDLSLAATAQEAGTTNEPSDPNGTKKLDAFIRLVEAQSGKHITVEAADALIEAVTDYIANL